MRCQYECAIINAQQACVVANVNSAKRYEETYTYQTV